MIVLYYKTFFVKDSNPQEKYLLLNPSFEGFIVVGTIKIEHPVTLS